MKDRIYIKSKLILGLSLFIFLSLLNGCKGLFGDKTDISFIEVPNFSVRPVSYVPIQPVITGFDNITDITTGFDELIYAVDAGKEEIICYDESMRELSRLKIKGVTKVVQDRRLDLFAIGRLDTIIDSVNYSLPCIYRLNLKSGGYGLSNADIYKKIVHPFYVNSSLKVSDTAVKFTGVAVLADNSFYVSRTGVSQNNLIGGPDDAVLYFSGLNRYIGFIQVVTSEGLKDDFFRSVVEVVSFVTPPQTQQVPLQPNFVVASNSSFDPLKVKFINFAIQEGSPVYSLNQDLVVGDTTKAAGFLYTPGRFSSPSDVALSGDGSKLVFVTDAVKDSLYVFTDTGLEGVVPPAGSTSLKNINVSFGGRGNDLRQFQSPVAVTYKKKVVYVADAGNKRILRFKLTTDFE